ncbi:hypothetical protein [Campylobacter troglodytis]|uniref:hypothetical protein n=1 Tax=Campylobacter troglodytis TaxID=654363 RepID=UPI00115BB0F1|nr:hypothetical protein [Campylobacter troglodytis]
MPCEGRIQTKSPHPLQMGNTLSPYRAVLGAGYENLENLQNAVVSHLLEGDTLSSSAVRRRRFMGRIV